MSLMLFQETHEAFLERQFSELKKEIGNVRRGLFARHSELEKKYQDTFFELELLKSSIAKQDIKIWQRSKSEVSTTSGKAKRNSPDLFMSI